MVVIVYFICNLIGLFGKIVEGKNCNTHLYRAVIKTGIILKNTMRRSAIAVLLMRGSSVFVRMCRLVSTDRLPCTPGI